MIARPHSPLSRSGRLPLSDQNEDSMAELGFLFWTSHLQSIKPQVDLQQNMTIVSSSGKCVVVQPVCDLGGSNAVFKVRDDQHRELVMKIGHSDHDKQLSEALCVQLHDQAEQEGKILGKVQGADDLAPRLVLTGYWNDKPVLLTELEGAPLLEEPLPQDPATVGQLCRDLSRTVLLLFHKYGVAHADISPKNIGVYHRPEEHQGRRFYLYDFGLAVEVNKQAKGPVSFMFSSLEAILKSGACEHLLISELCSVAYVCLYMAAGGSLPWQEAAARGDPWTCSEWRELYSMPLSLADNKELHSLSPPVRDWITFVLTQPADAEFHSVWSAACELLYSTLAR